MSHHYYADTQQLSINFMITTSLTPAHENTNTTIANIMVTEHTFHGILF